MSWLGAVALLGVLALCAALWVQWLVSRSVEDFIEDYERAFPGRCAFCGFYRMARLHGHFYGPTPPHEDCPEGRVGEEAER